MLHLYFPLPYSLPIQSAQLNDLQQVILKAECVGFSLKNKVQTYTKIIALILYFSQKVWCGFCFWRDTAMLFHDVSGHWASEQWVCSPQPMTEHQVWGLQVVHEAVCWQTWSGGVHCMCSWAVRRKGPTLSLKILHSQNPTQSAFNNHTHTLSSTHTHTPAYTHKHGWVLGTPHTASLKMIWCNSEKRWENKRTDEMRGWLISWDETERWCDEKMARKSSIQMISSRMFWGNHGLTGRESGQMSRPAAVPV